MGKTIEEMRAEYDRLHRRTVTPVPQTTEQAGSPLDPPATKPEVDWHHGRCADCQGGECLRGDVFVMRAFAEFGGREQAERMGYPEPERFPIQ
jgi:hypothetical protein